LIVSIAISFTDIPETYHIDNPIQASIFPHE